MKVITFLNPHRKKHFEFFNAMNHPHFNITANVEIGPFLKYTNEKQMPFNHALVYVLAKTANEIKEFRWRIRDTTIVEHEAVHPSFTVPTKETEVFSFCTVAFKKDIALFMASAKQISEDMFNNPSIEDEAERDDYLFMSAIPWISFTSIQHAMNYHPHDSVPRLSWGKFYKDGSSTKMPVAVQVHHALVDGRHVGAYFEQLETILKSPNKYLD
ncbi:MAG: chloramphenicol acetyltransferase [Croceitalea sp.]|nr:chloramphenicol acetyltransferase [Croceitalea sp.]